jgi:hypothetical protein
MKEHFRDAKLGPKNLVRIEQINRILDEYAGQGYRLTLRQLYYQLVSRDIIPNLDREYGNLSRILKEARMGGLVDWNYIEDRIRRPKLPYWVSDLDEAIQDTIHSYRLDRMKGQPNYIEVWIEKDALSSVFYRVTQKYGIRLMVNRGYSSVSAMYDSADRFMNAYKDGRNPIILYFGDHDPSGLDMIRDIKDRLFEFGLDVNVIPCALNKEQIAEYNPPPNPAKITDPRAKDYIMEHGDTSWELDALRPDVLAELTEKHVNELIDYSIYIAVLQSEEEDTNKLRNMLEE